MLATIKILTRLVEYIIALPIKLLRFILYAVVFNPRLGPLRYIAAVGLLYIGIAISLAYIYAPLRGHIGAYWMANKLNYDAERWMATAIYDKSGNFVGTFDPRLDSKRDVNYTGIPIELNNTGYVANPDHKSIPVQTIPEHYWKCLIYHEDRYLGGIFNPAGIDFLGVLKIPVTSFKRTIAARSPRVGMGGSTLSMQLARVIYNTPPRYNESAFEKLGRKLKEWWLAPVIFQTLTSGGDYDPFKRWVSDHLWLAQRTGGSSLHGVETASRVVFGKEARELTAAEQFVLASAVNKPIILLEGSERLNRVRLDRWRYIIEVRARKCAQALIDEPQDQLKVVTELVSMAGGPPDPQLRTELKDALTEIDPARAARARANPEFRANLLIPATRYGVREEMKSEYGFNWRNYVRGATLTFDAANNRRFRNKVQTHLTKLQKQYKTRIDQQYTLDYAKVHEPGAANKQLPDIIIAAANVQGEIVRYFEAKDTAAYFSSPKARNQDTGRYDEQRESRAIASTGKILAAIAIANQGRDTPNTKYVDLNAPEKGLESCSKNGNLRRGRKAKVVFACSLSGPLENRAARMGQEPMRRLIDGFGFNMPPAPTSEQETPPTTAAIRGMITGSPRKVHQMAGAVLASLLGQGHKPLKLPTLVKNYDRTIRDNEDAETHNMARDIVPNKLISRQARPMLKSLLSSPLCYNHRGRQHGTLKSLKKWCASANSNLRLHFAKTGTHVNEDPNATVDVWTTGGVQFKNGAAYSYVVLVGTGSTRAPWARNIHAAQMAAPLLDVLLNELQELAKSQPAPMMIAKAPKTRRITPSTSKPTSKKSAHDDNIFGDGF